jgi:hypothetical protein
MLGGPPAVAVLAAVTAAMQTVARAAAAIHLELMLTPFERGGLGRRRRIMPDRPRAVNAPS